MDSSKDNGKVNTICLANQKKIPKGHHYVLSANLHQTGNLKHHVIEQHLPYFWNVTHNMFTM